MACHWTGWRRLAVALVLAAPLAVANNFGLTRQVLDQVDARFGAAARQRLEAWQGLLIDLGSASTRDQLQQVNSFFNAVPYADDSQHWRQEDYWATPAELLTSHAGDCEDYAIAKYFTLRALGVPTGQLRLNYVRARRINQPHMVLTWYDPQRVPEPMVLDNLDSQVRPASQRSDLQPVYSFNGDGLWLAQQRGKTVRVGKAEELDLWRNLQQRMDLAVAEWPTAAGGLSR